MWCSTVARGDPLSYQQMVRVHLTIRKWVLSPWVVCAGRQSTASTLTGPQTPEDSTPTCPFITWATSCLGNLRSLCACLSGKTNPCFVFSLAQQFSSVWESSSTSVCPVVTSEAQILTLQTKWGSEMIEANTVLHHSYTMRRTNKAAIPLSL